MNYDELNEQLSELRPKLHRYCARMTGSVIDGEDVAQDALLKATVALSSAQRIANIESWLFRIAHNAAIDFLRRRERMEAVRSDMDPDLLSNDESPVDEPEIVAASLRTFMRLPVSQRSAVILMDVLGYRLTDISAIIDASLPAVKSNLHRGRARLRELSLEPEDRPPAQLSQTELNLLQCYIARFNARDFTAIREMLAEEVRLDLVNTERRQGRRRVAHYFENYAKSRDWSLSPGLVEGRPAVLVHDSDNPAQQPGYFVLLQWQNAQISNIRDFRYARYVVSGADIVFLEEEQNGVESF